jgi:hypothetical protein
MLKATLKSRLDIKTNLSSSISLIYEILDIYGKYSRVGAGIVLDLKCKILNK